MVRTRNQPFVYDASGNVTSTIVLDGGVIGVWDRKGDDEVLHVKAAGFDPFDKSLRERIGDETELIARAVGARDVDVEFTEDLVDLTRAPRNRFMSPLSGA